MQKGGKLVSSTHQSSKDSFSKCPEYLKVCPYCKAKLSPKKIQDPFGGGVRWIPDDTHACEKMIEAQNIYLYEERLADYTQKLNACAIPKRFKSALLSNCPRDVQSHFEGDKLASAYLMGKSGAGKTYTAIAALKQALWNGHSASFIKAVDLPAIYSSARSYEAEQDTTSRICARELIVLDDLGKQAHTQQAALRIFSVIDKIYNDDKALIVTTQYTDEQLIDMFESSSDEQTAQAILRRLRDMCKAFYIERN